MFTNYQLIIGYGISGRYAAAWFQRQGTAFYIYDEAPLDADIAEHSIDFETIKQTVAYISNAMVSPGFSPGHPLIKWLTEKQVELETDIDIFDRHYSCKKIAVTGTNGKSTVTTWLNKALNERSRWCAVGNIGQSALSLPQEPLDGAVIELSSGQLHYMSALRYDCAVILPIAVDHLDWHGSAEAYKQAKLKLLQSRHVVLHESLDEYKASNVISYGPRGDVSWQHDSITLPEGQKISFDPQHYWRCVDKENLCAVVAALYTMGVVYERLPNFPALKHRASRTLLPSGWTVINDSKATNLHATQHTLWSIRKAYPNENLVLLLGGIFKESFVLPEMEEGDRVLLFGKYLYENVSEHHSWPAYPSLYDAVKALRADMKHETKGIIVFAPGGASFDEFDNYSHRGEMFDTWVALDD